MAHGVSTDSLWQTAALQALTRELTSVEGSLQNAGAATQSAAQTARWSKT
jgi:hypothetical protein